MKTNSKKKFEPEDKGEPGFTLRSCVIAVVLTIFLMITSSYIALKIGALPWPIIFSVVIAAASLQVISRVSRKTNVHEINVAQSGGTIGGLLASGVVFTIPGILYLQSQGVTVPLPSVISLASVCITAGVLGVLLSVPLRNFSRDRFNTCILPNASRDWYWVSSRSQSIHKFMVPWISNRLDCIDTTLGSLSNI